MSMRLVIPRIVMVRHLIYHMFDMVEGQMLVRLY